MCSRKNVFVKESMSKRKNMSFLFISLPWLSNGLLWSINKLKQGLWCTMRLSYIYVYIYTLYIYCYIYIYVLYILYICTIYTIYVYIYYIYTTIYMYIVFIAIFNDEYLCIYMYIYLPMYLLYIYIYIYIYIIQVKKQHLFLKNIFTSCLPQFYYN